MYESSAAKGVLQRSLKDMGEPLNVHQGFPCAAVAEHGQAAARIRVELEENSPCTGKWRVRGDWGLVSAFAAGGV